MNTKTSKVNIKRNCEELMHYETLRNFLLEKIEKSKSMPTKMRYQDILEVLDLSAVCSNSAFTDTNVEKELNKVYFILS